MKKETKDLVVNMVNAWNLYNPQKRVDAHFDENEFQKGFWSLDVAMSDVIQSDFFAFLVPALQVNNCIWFFSGYKESVIMHIQ